MINNVLLPKGWISTNLIDVSLEIVSGSGFPKKYQGEDNGKYPFAKVADISKRHRNSQKYISSAANYVSDEIKTKTKAKVFKRNTIVFPKIGEALKNNYRLICSCDILFDNNVMGVLPSCQNVECKFVYYFLTTQDFGRLSVATAVPSIRRGDIENIKVLLPPLNEQRRIVAKIEELFSEIDKGVESLETARAQLKVYRQALLKHAFEGKLTAQWRADNPDKVVPAETLLAQIRQAREERYQQLLAEWKRAVEKWEFGGKEGKKPSKPRQYKELSKIENSELENLVTLPPEWKYVRLAEVAEIGSGMSVSQNRKLFDPIKVSYLRVANVQRGQLVLDEIRTMNIERSKLQDLELQHWDVLFNEGGDRDKLGRGWVWESQVSPCITQNHVFRATTYLGLEHVAKFISHWGNSFGQKYFDSEGKQTTNLASINKTVLSNFPIPLPSVDEQEEILLALDSNLSVIEQFEQDLEKGLRQAELLRQSILKKAFSGQLVPQDPSDEPASKLLERIKTEKAERAAKEKQSAKKSRKAKG